MRKLFVLLVLLMAASAAWSGSWWFFKQWDTGAQVFEVNERPFDIGQTDVYFQATSDWYSAAIVDADGDRLELWPTRQTKPQVTIVWDQNGLAINPISGEAAFVNPGAFVICVGDINNLEWCSDDENREFVESPFGHPDGVRYWGFNNGIREMYQVGAVPVLE